MLEVNNTYIYKYFIYYLNMYMSEHLLPTIYSSTINFFMVFILYFRFHQFLYQQHLCSVFLFLKKKNYNNINTISIFFHK